MPDIQYWLNPNNTYRVVFIQVRPSPSSCLPWLTRLPLCRVKPPGSSSLAMISSSTHTIQEVSMGTDRYGTTNAGWHGSNVDVCRHGGPTTPPVCAMMGTDAPSRSPSRMSLGEPCPTSESSLRRSGATVLQTRRTSCMMGCFVMPPTPIPSILARSKWSVDLIGEMGTDHKYI